MHVRAQKGKKQKKTTVAVDIHRHWEVIRESPVFRRTCPAPPMVREDVIGPVRVRFRAPPTLLEDVIGANPRDPDPPGELGPALAPGVEKRADDAIAVTHPHIVVT